MVSLCSSYIKAFLTMKMLLLQLSTVSKCLATLQHYPHGKESGKGKQLFTVWFLIS